MATTQIILDVDSTIIIEAVNALCALNGYAQQVPDPANPEQFIANPESKAQFAKRMIGKYIRNAIVEQRNRAAQAAVVGVSDTLIAWENKMQTINIAEITDTDKLKALAFDQIGQIEQAKAGLQAITGRLAQLEAAAKAAPAPQATEAPQAPAPAVAPEA